MSADPLGGSTSHVQHGSRGQEWRDTAPVNHLSRRIGHLGLVLAILSVLLLVKGTVEFCAPNHGQDFRYRWSTQQYIFAGIDPFRVAFWTADHKQALPPDIPRDVAAKAGDPVNVVDPPWVFAFGALIFPPQREFATVWFILLNIAAICLLACLIYKFCATLSTSLRLFCTAIFFTNLAFSQQLINGNYGTISMAGVAGCFFLLRSRSATLSGIAFAVAQIKMTLGAPVVLPLLMRRRAGALLVVYCSVRTGQV